MSLWIKAAYPQFSPALQSLAAKSTQKNALQWLPAWVHFADTANIIRSSWLHGFLPLWYMRRIPK